MNEWRNVGLATSGRHELDHAQRLSRSGETEIDVIVLLPGRRIIELGDRLAVLRARQVVARTAVALDALLGRERRLVSLVVVRDVLGLALELLRYFVREDPGGRRGEG